MFPRSVLSLAFAAVVCVTTAYPQQATKSPAPVKKPAKATPKPAAQPAPAGLVVVKDPDTGELRQATAEEIGALSDAAQTAGGGSQFSTNAAGRRAAPPQAIRGVGGMPGVRLGDDTHSYSVVTMTPDGKLVEDCVTGSDAAAAALSKSVTPKSTKAKEVWDDK